MATGKEDYWYGFLPLKSIFGTNQIPKYLLGGENIVPGASSAIIEYIVPSGYRFFLSSYIVSANMPGQQLFILHQDLLFSNNVYFDTNFEQSYSGEGVLIFDNGAPLKLTVSNHDDVNVIFWASITGFLQGLPY